ncbi:citryl-CoA lyase [Phaeovulum sp. W22_SRMD_FR3]|uniref:citryl-CoA lyase n=1 Tax=Phaeovulum sp. W22_SRMD_FR3 TaxID=3240274 RepID=UPI003F9DF9DF
MTTAKASPQSEIAIAERARVVVRGADLCRDLIGKESFTAYFLRLLGVEATPKLVAVVDATLMAIAEHGLVPSVQAARMTYAAAPDALQGAVAAGLLGCGSVVLGASEEAGYFLAGIIAAAGEDGDYHAAALDAVSTRRAERRALPGFGHPVHRDGDPRAERLLELAEELEVSGAHVRALNAVRSVVPEVYGRVLPMNVSAAIPALLLDAGYPIGALKGVPLVARTAGLIAHLLEEQANPIGFRLSDAAAEAVAYTGGYPDAEDTAGAAA